MATATATKPQTEQQPAQAQGSPPATTKAKHPLVAFKEHVESRMSELAYALPPHISPDRFTRVLLTALQRNPGLLKCTRQSLWNACLLAAQDGLLPDGREGAIAPYGVNEKGQRVAELATWMPMIEGLRKKARNSGDISNWEVHVVRAKDKFSVSLGDDAKIVHEPYFGAEDPGEVVGAYSIAWLKDGSISRDVMTKRDIDKVRAKSKAQKGPWSDGTFYPEMCKKTVARRHYKQLPHSSDLDEFIARDDQAFGLEERSEGQIEARQQRRVASTAAAFDQFAGNDDEGQGQTIDHEPTSQTETQTEETTGDGAVAGDQMGDFEDDQPTGGDGAKNTAEDPKSGNAAEGSKTGNAADTGKTADDKKEDGWPADQVPKTAADYLKYTAAKVAAMTDGAAVADWFKSKAERELRNQAGVTKDEFDAAKVIATKRINDLNKKVG